MGWWRQRCGNWCDFNQWLITTSVERRELTQSQVFTIHRGHIFTRLIDIYVYLCVTLLHRIVTSLPPGLVSGPSTKKYTNSDFPVTSGRSKELKLCWCHPGLHTLDFTFFFFCKISTFTVLWWWTNRWCSSKTKGAQQRLIGNEI